MNPTDWIFRASTGDCPTVPDPVFECGTAKSLEINRGNACPTVPDSKPYCGVEIDITSRYAARYAAGPKCAQECGTAGQFSDGVDTERVASDFCRDESGTGPVSLGQSHLTDDQIAVLATWYGLDPRFWADESFSLRAAALGHHGPPPPPQGLSSGGECRAGWISVAESILARNFRSHPADRSTLESREIGLRAFRGIPVCSEALSKLSVVTPANWRKADLRAGKLLPR